MKAVIPHLGVAQKPLLEPVSKPYSFTRLGRSSGPTRKEGVNALMVDGMAPALSPSDFRVVCFAEVHFIKNELEASTGGVIPTYKGGSANGKIRLLRKVEEYLLPG